MSSVSLTQLEDKMKMFCVMLEHVGVLGLKFQVIFKTSVIMAQMMNFAISVRMISKIIFSNNSFKPLRNSWGFISLSADSVHTI